MKLKIVNVFFLLVLAMLQYQLWYGKNGLAHFQQLQQQLVESSHKNAELANRNAILTSTVTDLKQGVTFIEHYARQDLGMIKQGETFFQLVE